MLADARNLADRLLARLRSGELRKIDVDVIRGAIAEDNLGWELDEYEAAVTRYVVEHA